MSIQANIRDVQILGDLKTAFGRFGEDVLQVLAALEKQFEEIQERLEDRQEHWQRQADEAENQVHEARRALAVCEDSGYYDDEGDYQAPECSFEEDQVAEAERHLAQCEENLETVKQWRHRIEGQIADFEGDMHRLSNLATSRTNSVQSFLANKIEILDRYVGGSSNAAAGLRGQNQSDTIRSGLEKESSIPQSVSIDGLWKVLPPGIHPTTLKEIEARFATNAKRKRLFEGFQKGVGALRLAGCKTVFLDGSFITDKSEPGDFDACWNPTGVDDSKLDPVLLDFDDLRKRQKEVFCGEFFPSSVKADGSITYLEFFQIDKHTKNQKGILEIKI